MQQSSPFKFETFGQLSMRDAVVGVATKNKNRRLIAVVLTQGLSPHKRKEKLALAREQINSDIISLSNRRGRLTRKFTDAGAKQIKASIKSAWDAGPGIQYMLNETDQPIIIFDCQDKGAFWSTLKTLGVDDETLFALAELEALKPEDIHSKEVKSVGTAHLLCEKLSKSAEADKKELIDFITKAKKFKIPEFNLFKETMAAQFRNGMTPTLIKHGVFYTTQIVGRAAISIGKLTEKFGWKTFPSSKRAFIIANHRRAHEFNKRRNPETSDWHYQTVIRSTEEMTEEQVDTTFGTPPHKVPVPEDKQEYLEHESVYELGAFGVFNLNVRDGRHFLKQDKSLFEFDYILAEGETAKVYGLAHQVGGEIKIRFFTLQNGALSHINTSGVIELDEDMRMSGWREIDNKTGNIVRQQAVDVMRMGEQSTHLVPGFMAHIANMCARMNEADYFAHIIEPTGGGGRMGRHKHPYFEYEVVEDPLQPTHIRVVSSDRRIGPQLRQSPIFHQVSRHTRTLYRGTVDEHVMIIGPHTRGDASKGVKKKDVRAVEPKHQ
ncbi:MAG: hypothetical protein AAF549_06345 [Pseudomonadota bacterium]